MSKWGPIEVAAVLFLTVGAFVAPLLGPAAGLVLAWVSNRWTTREKLVATAIGLIFVLPLLLLLAGGGGSGAAG